MSQTFRLRATETIEAIQFTGGFENAHEVCEFIFNHGNVGWYRPSFGDAQSDKALGQKISFSAGLIDIPLTWWVVWDGKNLYEQPDQVMVETYELVEPESLGNKSDWVLTDQPENVVRKYLNADGRSVSAILVTEEALDEIKDHWGLHKFEVETTALGGISLIVKINHSNNQASFSVHVTGFDYLVEDSITKKFMRAEKTWFEANYKEDTE